jgi:SAM-dependent methyltransferase
MADDLERRQNLNLGSGKKYDDRAINLDITEATNPDVVHDLEQVPWPFPDDRFEHIEAIDVIEHLSDPLAAMREIHRITRTGGTVTIALPHFSSSNAFTDLTHRSQFGYFSFDYVTGEHFHDFYTADRFLMKRRRIWFRPSLLNRVAQKAANRWPAQYEQRWAWIFPALFLEFELEVVSSSRN